MEDVKIMGKRKLMLGKNAAKNSVYVSLFLDGLGIPRKLKGYGYLKTTILSLMDDQSRFNSLHSNIYEPASHILGIKPNSIDHVIRKARMTGWDEIGYEKERAIGRKFHCKSRPSKLTNKELLRYIIRYLSNGGDVNL